MVVDEVLICKSILYRLIKTVFTLVEVLIVILVMGILADLSIGFFSNKMVNDRLKIVNRALPLLSC